MDHGELNTITSRPLERYEEMWGSSVTSLFAAAPTDRFFGLNDTNDLRDSKKY
jgi:hypothetical protein